MIFRRWTNVFSFTFTQHIRSKGFRLSTLIAALVFLVLIPVVLLLTTAPGGSGAPVPCTADAVIVSDTTGLDFDWQTLGSLGCPDISYTAAPDLESALKDAGTNDRSLVLHIGQEAGSYTLTVILPENTALTQDDADSFSEALGSCFSAVLARSAGLTSDQLASLNAEVSSAVESGSDGAGADQALMEALGMMVPYIVLMLLYFLILFYGQGVANSVILEKSSKLMDTFLVSIHPAAMIMGKLLAIAAAGIFQLLCWVAGIAGGFGAGILLLKLTSPGAEAAVVQIISSLSAATSLFSPAAGLTALAFVIAGFLMYCALSAIGGSLASKQEDLSSTNFLFSLALVVSFLVSLSTDTLNGGLSTGSSWVYYVPFTAVLTVPGRVLLGDLTIGQSLISLGLTLALTAVLILAAGKTYVLMSFWKGNPPSLKKLFNILVHSKSEKEKHRSV